MPVAVRIPPVWRKSTRGKAEVQVEGETVREALISLAQQWPEIGGRLYGADGQVAQGLSVFLNHESIKHLQGPETPVAAGDRIMILIAIAGG